jgi:hypothetical protein
MPKQPSPSTFPDFAAIGLVTFERRPSFIFYAACGFFNRLAPGL